MPFVKLDCGMLRSSIWTEKDQRDLFITALLMCEPFEVIEPMPQIYVDRLEFTGWSVPPGWYGLASAASTSIIHQAMVDKDDGLRALEQMGAPDAGSKSKAFEGRRLVRVDGGFIALNFIDYRDRDYTGAERSKRWRERQKTKAAEEEAAAKKRANGGTIRPEHVKRPPPGPKDPQSAAGRHLKANGKGNARECLTPVEPPDREVF